jgi:hypothetical protein
MSTISDALRTIISCSPAAAAEAADCIRAIGANSPIVQARYNLAASHALSDRQAYFETDQRSLIAEFMSAQDDDAETRSVVTLRLTPTERAEIAQAANAAEQTVSEYMRKRLLG